MRFLASKSESRNVVLVDGDKYSESNMGRQEFPAACVNMNKAEAQKARYDSWYDGKLQIIALPKYVGKDNVAGIINDYSAVFMCVDNHVCRRIVSARCGELSNVVLISGGNEYVDGNVQCHMRMNKTNITLPIDHRHPEIVSANDGDRSEMSCEELASLPGGGQIIITNLVAATIMLQFYWRVLNCDARAPGNVLPDEVYFDINQIKTARVVKGELE
jgi:molybdopterin/thiamine biosynthesis adenylyltransferase